MVDEQKQRVFKATIIAFMSIKTITAKILVVFHKDKAASESLIKRVVDMFCSQTIVHEAHEPAIPTFYFKKLLGKVEPQILFIIK